MVGAPDFERMHVSKCVSLAVCMCVRGPAQVHVHIQGACFVRVLACIVRVYVCVYACVCAYVCVSL